MTHPTDQTRDMAEKLRELAKQKRLHNRLIHDIPTADLYAQAIIEAADEIDRLKARVEELETANMFWGEDCEECHNEASEVIEAFYHYEGEDGEYVISMSCARTLPRLYAVVTIHQSDKIEHQYSFKLFTSAEEARAALNTEESSQ